MQLALELSNSSQMLWCCEKYIFGGPTPREFDTPQAWDSVLLTSHPRDLGGNLLRNSFRPALRNLALMFLKVKKRKTTSVFKWEVVLIWF